MALRELGAMGNCGCARCLKTYSRREQVRVAILIGVRVCDRVE